MAEADGAEDNQQVEAPEEEIDDNDAIWRHLGQYIEARRALPWEQWTFREKASYFMDRMFLGFIILFILVLFGVISYKMWYVSNMKKITAFLSGSVVWLFGWLFPEEGQEELRGL